MTLSLTKPAAGSVGWTAAVNQNFTDVETAVNSYLLTPLIGYPIEILRGTSAFMLDSFFHWGGFNVCDRDSTVNGNNFLNGSPTVRFAEENDSSRRTTYLEVQISTEEAGAAVWDLYTAIPPSFVSWGSNGIRLKTKVQSWLGGTADTARFKLEVFGATGSSQASQTRTVTNPSTDTNYQYVTVTQASLNGMGNPLLANDLLHLRITLDGTFDDGIPTVRIGRIEVDWKS